MFDPEVFLSDTEPAERAPVLPEGSADRKNLPVGTVMCEYFPRAFAYVALVSQRGNEKHNPGQPLHWSRHKSSDHRDCVARHMIDAGAFDADGMRHSGGLAWRALAILELELEAAEKNDEPWWQDGAKRVPR